MAAEEKTEEATPRRRQKEKEKGNIARSQDMNAALALLAAIALFVAFGPKMMDKLQTMMHYALTHLTPHAIEANNISALIGPYFTFMSNAIFPFMAVLFISTIVVLYTQIGPMFASEKLKPKLDALSPMGILNSAKEKLNPFNPKNLVEFVKSILKMIVVFAAGYSVLNSRKDELFGLTGASVDTGFAVIGSILTQMALTICFLLLIIGYLDKKYQTYEFEKSIKMTKNEIKDEYKDVEGDPHIKSKMRATQMRFAQQKMVAAVPTADVIVTNPTHYAIAIKYDRLKSPAPIVVAKGVDYLAFKIREIATANNVPIVENRPLAQALYKLVPVDGSIPAELYVAVAEVLAWVYNKNKSEVAR